MLTYRIDFLTEYAYGYYDLKKRKKKTNQISACSRIIQLSFYKSSKLKSVPKRSN